MLQQDEPDDYVVGTGETHSVGELVDISFNYLGLDPSRYVREDPKFMRPAEVDLLIADPSKAQKELGWERTVDFEHLVKLMIDADMALLKEGSPVSTA
jgi:GDPmannose 4,6-dehydratase